MARPWLRRLAISAAVALATFCMQLPFFDRWFSSMDEGHLLLFAEIAAEGGTLYRDATFYPLPGAFYLLALLFRVFEPSMLVARFAVVVEFALFVAIVHDLMRRAVPARLALAVVPLLWAYRVWCFPHWQMYSYSTTALLVYALSLRLLVAYFESQRRALLAAAGCVYGLGVFCKQDYGAAVLLATLITLGVATRSRRDVAGSPGFVRTAGVFLAPAAAVGLGATLHFLQQGVLGDVLRFCVLNHFTGMSDFEYPSFPPLLPLFSKDELLRTVQGLSSHFPTLVRIVDFDQIKQSWWFRKTPLWELYAKTLIYGPWLLVAGGALRVWRTRARLADLAQRGPALIEVLLLAIAGAFAALVHLVKPQDTVHLFVLTWPFFCLALVYASALWQVRRPLALGAAVVLLPVALATFAYTGRLAWALREHFPAPIEVPRGQGIFVRPVEAQILRELVELVQAETERDETLGVFPYYPILHFLADRRGPHRTGYIVWPYPEIEDRDLEVARAMEKQQTPLVILHVRQIRQLGRAESYAPLLYAYLVERYSTFRMLETERASNVFVALRRNPGTQPGRRLLKRIGDARLRIERGDSSRELNPAERDDFARIVTWYFRRTLALRPTADGRSVLSVPLRARPGERLRTAVGTHPDVWSQQAPSVSFRIEVVAGSQRETLYARTLDPRNRAEDRGWFEVELPLDAYVDREVSLELSTSTPHPAGETRLLGGFAVPRLVPAQDRAEAAGLRATTR